MKYRDMLGKRKAIQTLSEEENIPGIDPPLTFAQVRRDATTVLMDPSVTCEVENGMAVVILALLDARLSRG